MSTTTTSTTNENNIENESANPMTPPRTEDRMGIFHNVRPFTPVVPTMRKHPGTPRDVHKRRATKDWTMLQKQYKSIKSLSRNLKIKISIMEYNVEDANDLCKRINKKIKRRNISDSPEADDFRTHEAQYYRARDRYLEKVDEYIRIEKQFYQEMLAYRHCLKEYCLNADQFTNEKEATQVATLQRKRDEYDSSNAYCGSHYRALYNDYQALDEVIAGIERSRRGLPNPQPAVQQEQSTANDTPTPSGLETIFNALSL